MMEAVRTYQTSVYFNETKSAISQKALIFTKFSVCSDATV
jgi:hypothetical protein